MLKYSALILVAMNATLAAIGIVPYAEYLRQPQWWLTPAELAAMLLTYAAVAVVLIPLCKGPRAAVCRYGLVFGLITGAAEVLNVVLETWQPQLASGAFSIAFMLVIFSIWGVAAAFIKREIGSVRVGIACAVTSAALCMLIAVAAGFVIELLIVPPNTSVVAAWPEFKRSGWTDVRAFAAANTLDSGFSHLLIAPFVATVFGFVGSVLVRRKAG